MKCAWLTLFVPGSPSPAARCVPELTCPACMQHVRLSLRILLLRPGNDKQQALLCFYQQGTCTTLDKVDATMSSRLTAQQDLPETVMALCHACGKIAQGRQAGKLAALVPEALATSLHALTARACFACGTMSQAITTIRGPALAQRLPQANTRLHQLMLPRKHSLHAEQVLQGRKCHKAANRQAHLLLMLLLPCLLAPFPAAAAATLPTGAHMRSALPVTS